MGNLVSKYGETSLVPLRKMPWTRSSLMMDLARNWGHRVVLLSILSEMMDERYIYIYSFLLKIEIYGFSMVCHGFFHGFPWLSAFHIFVDSIKGGFRDWNIFQHMNPIIAPKSPFFIDLNHPQTYMLHIWYSHLLTFTPKNQRKIMVNHGKSYRRLSQQRSRNHPIPSRFRRPPAVARFRTGRALKELP